MEKSSHIYEIRRLNIVKMQYTQNDLQIPDNLNQELSCIFAQNYKLILIFIWIFIGPRLVKIMLKKKATTKLEDTHFLVSQVTTNL